MFFLQHLWFTRILFFKPKLNFEYRQKRMSKNENQSKNIQELTEVFEQTF